MRTKIITHITSFSTTGKMYEAIKRVSHELQISASDLIRQAIEEFLQKHSLEALRAALRERYSFRTLREDGMLKAMKGVTTIEEVLRVS